MSYHTRILDFLRADYGIDDAEITRRSSKHPKLLFTYLGKRCHVTLQRDNNDAPDLFNMKRQDIKRLLGTPPDMTLQSSQKRTLDQMTADLQAKAPSPGEIGSNLPTQPSPPMLPKSAQGRVCRYADRIKFMPPASLLSSFKGKALTVRRLDGARWKIEPHPDPTHKWPQIRFNHKQWGMEISRPTSLYEDLPLFGASPASYQLVDGAFIVELDTSKLAPRQSKTRQKATLPATGELPNNDGRTGPYLADAGGEVTHAQMHAALEEVRRIERLSLYRLVKLKGADEAGGGERWVFRAPLVE